MDEPVYKLPSLRLGPKILMAAELVDKVDWGLEIHGIPAAWVSKGEGIKVGVGDTGLPVHSDLEGAVIAAKDFTDSPSINDSNGHSTHVCGTIAARENGKGVVGVAPRSSLVIAKVLSDSGSGSMSGIVAGVNYLVDQGCDIISLSLGGSSHPALKTAIDRAVSRGIFVICAAGNEGMGNGSTVGSPANLPNVIAIASYNKSGNLSEFSSRGPEVDFAFPGENILSTWPKNTYRQISGTSMATPFCAGLVAELLSEQRAADQDGRPVLKRIRNNKDLLEHLKACSIDKGPTGFDNGWGWGVVDVKKFLKTVGNTPPPPPPPLSDVKEIDLGLMRIRYPVTVDGKQGWFVFIP